MTRIFKGQRPAELRGNGGDENGKTQGEEIEKADSFQQNAQSSAAASQAESLTEKEAGFVPDAESSTVASQEESLTEKEKG